MPLRASWSAHALGDKLLASKCGGDAMLLRVVSSRVVLLGAPSRLCLPPSSAEQLWPTAASSCRRARTTTSIPGRGDWWLSATIIGILRAAVRLPAVVAHLHLRVRARSSPLVQHAYAAAAWVCACATQGSERCFARCRLDAVLRQLRSLAHAWLPQAVRLLPGRGISAGRLASSRLALSRHARCSRVTSRRTASRGSARGTGRKARRW